MLHNGLDILLRQGGAPGDLLNDFLVVVGKVQLFRQAAAQLPASAAKLPADGDNTIHNNRLLFTLRS